MNSSEVGDGVENMKEWTASEHGNIAYEVLRVGGHKLHVVLAASMVSYSRRKFQTSRGRRVRSSYPRMVTERTFVAISHMLVECTQPTTMVIQMIITRTLNRA